MCNLEEYVEYRAQLLADSKDEYGFVNEQEVLTEVMPALFEAKLVDTAEPNDAYYCNVEKKHKLNAYAINESGERLQLFIVDEGSIFENTSEEQFYVSLKKKYEKQLQRTEKFLRYILAGNEAEIQESDPIRPLISKLISEDGFKQFDTIDIFLVSLTATVSNAGGVMQPRSMYFSEKNISASIHLSSGKKIKKEFLILPHLIDMNRLSDIQVATGNAAPLEIDFEKTFKQGIQVLKAADEENFESYLCVLNAGIIAGLYKRFSTRLLEKNVRSFLQFKGVNAEMKKTIRKEPEKFIAYNNGLTITATDAKWSNKKGALRITSLVDFQIVNGGQTTASIYFSKKEGIDVSNINVMAKINVVKNASPKELDKLISNISEFSNAQSRVSKVDLRARNPQLVKFKKLTESVPTPTGDSWFFERAKGEYQTRLRLEGRKKNSIKKKYPPNRRFSKELLAKYYSAWGDSPYLVKKGGEKIFRYFIEDLDGTKNGAGPIDVNRDFYENVISRILLFREMENIHGTRNKALGQLRSAVIPYAISVLYKYTDGIDDGRYFDFQRIWHKQGLDDDLSGFMEEMMKLMYVVIKDYAKSDDFGEYSKRQELWDDIKDCPEVRKFMKTGISIQIIEKYTTSSSSDCECSVNKQSDIILDTQMMSVEEGCSF